MAKQKQLSTDSNGSAYVSRGVLAGVHTTTAGVMVGSVRVKAEWSQSESTDARINALGKLESQLLQALDEINALRRDLTTEGM